jgi:hypothetical protein
MSIAGALTGAIGSFYSAKNQQYQLKSQALSLEFERSIANINARAAELDAKHILEAGRHQKALVTLQAGQVKASQRVSQAAAGIQGGVGSAAEVLASTELAKRLDSLTIDANTARAAMAARSRAVNFQNQSLLTGVSAQNLRDSAGSISPFMAAGTSLLGSASRVASRHVANRRQSFLFSRGRGR